MRVLLRTDASLLIGLGHVMRCLTLAEALRAGGAECHFICRELPGHAAALIRQHGFSLSLLPAPASEWAPAAAASSLPPHAAWLGVDWGEDAAQTQVAAGAAPADWLVVDHYALDARWELAVQTLARHLLVIDDLADRCHVADLLLDQNLGRAAAAYTDRVAPHCRLLLGPTYALLRPQFAHEREASILRRDQAPTVRSGLIALGGIDPGNVTGKVLHTLAGMALAADTVITVVLGAQAPWLAQLRQQAETMPWPVRVLSGVENMAEVLMTADWAIGAAGGSAWERCCLGVPSLLVLLAENQRPGMQALIAAGAAQGLGAPAQLATTLPACWEAQQVGGWQQLSAVARQLCDGRGTERVVEQMMEMAR